MAGTSARPRTRQGLEIECSPPGTSPDRLERMSSEPSFSQTLLDQESSRSRAVKAVLALQVGLLSIELSQVAATLIRLGKMNSGVLIPQSYFSALGARGEALRITAVITALVTMAIWIAWFHLVYSNLRYIGTGKTECRPGWAIGYWFLPLLNLFRPFQLAREVWIRSSIANSQESVDEFRTPPILGWWWFACFVSFFLNQFSEWMTGRVEGPESLGPVAAVEILAIFTSLAVCMLTLRVVEGIHALQSCALAGVEEATCSAKTGAPSDRAAVDDTRRAPRFLTSIPATAWFTLVIFGVGVAGTAFEVNRLHSAKVSSFDVQDQIDFCRLTGQYEEALQLAREALAGEEQLTPVGKYSRMDAEWTVKTLETLTRLKSDALRSGPGWRRTNWIPLGSLRKRS
jgi:Domain of unknown function (DUF4328)